MNKPLTIDELKALEVGDWVWVENLEHKEYSLYAKVLQTMSGDNLIVDYVYGNFYPLEQYGTKWLVYKNKEMAESKGNIERLNEVYDYLYDCLNNAATCIAQKDTNVAHVEVDAWLEFDLVIDLSNARYFDNTTMEWKELRGEK